MPKTYTIGYLILAHHYPEQLARLVDALDNEKVVFFIYIDGKTDIAPFEAALPENERLMYIRDRIDIYWMGYSTITATLALMETALLSPLRCRYYTLLSGADYPIKSNDYILRFFDSASVQVIKTFRLEDQPVWYPKIREYHFLDNRFLNRRGRIAKRYSRLHAVLTALYLFMRRFFPKRNFLPGLEPYGGSQWWSLTWDCLSYAYTALRSNPKLCRFYALTDGPDEMIFHTVIMNSHFGNKVRELRREQPWDDCPNLITEYGNNYRYIDWSPTREHPAVLLDEDLDKMMASDDLFARKFDPIRSKSVLDKIDQLIRSKNGSSRLSVGQAAI